MTSAQASAVSQWWVSTTGAAEGPYSEAYVVAALKTRSLAPTAQACPVGGNHWRPLSQWSPFAAVVRAADPALHSPSTPEQLPRLGKWICIYAVAVWPVLFVLYSVATVLSWATYDFESEAAQQAAAFDMIGIALRLALTVVAVIGGVQLGALKRMGATLLQVAIIASFGIGMLEIIIYIGIGEVPLVTDAFTVGDLVILLILPVALADLVFTILALVWLFQNGSRLSG